jgi:uncharacterized protein GlcG (DUF336 family)
MDLGLIAIPSNLSARVLEKVSPDRSSTESRIPDNGRIMIFAGGVPLRRNGTVIGAVRS